MAKELMLLPKAKYEHLFEKTREKADMTNEPEESSKFEESSTDPLESTIEYLVPKNRLKKALGLWNYLKDKKGKVFNWNENGEILVDGEVIPQTHIADLIKDVVSNHSSKRPLVYEPFHKTLKDLHPPDGFIVKRQTGGNDLKEPLTLGG